MNYDIKYELLEGGKVRIFEANSGKSAKFAKCQQECEFSADSTQVELFLCDCKRNPVEYPLLKIFFEKAASVFSSLCTEKKKSFTGCMLGIDSMTKRALVKEIEKAGGQWQTDISPDEICIIVGKDLSDVDVEMIQELRHKWKTAEIYTLPGFQNYLKTGINDDYARRDFNTLLEHCIFSEEDGYFRWPETEVYPGIGMFDPSGMREKGVLAEMGYHVGNNGIDEDVRHRILEYAYTGALPLVESFDYMREWNVPKTPMRLLKIANCLAAFARNLKRRNSDSYERSIKDWEKDLAWLKQRFYDGIYDGVYNSTYFPWPYV